MKAVKGKNKVLSFIGLEESRLFNKIESAGFFNISNLTEREHVLAKDMFARNIIRKVKNHNNVGYKIYPQRDQI